jgi:hypothetical protein
MILDIEEAYNILSDLWSFRLRWRVLLPHSVQACTMLFATASEAPGTWAKSMIGIAILGSKTEREVWLVLQQK